MSDFRRVFAVTARYSISKNALCGSYVIAPRALAATLLDGARGARNCVPKKLKWREEPLRPPAQMR